MPVLTIKGMPPTLYRQLKKRAAEHRRSLNSEILLTLEQSVKAARDVKDWLARADALRAKVKNAPMLTERRLRAMKSEARERLDKVYATEGSDSDPFLQRAAVRTLKRTEW